MFASAVKLVLEFIGLKARSFEKRTRSPAACQEKVLLDYLRRNVDTEYGRKYGFASIGSVEEYRKKVPIGSFETFYPYIERMTNGENNVLTSDSVMFYGVTSGTTGKPKLIPITALSRKKKTEVTDLWSYYVYRSYPDIPDGKILVIVSPVAEGYTPSGHSFGAESGHVYKSMPEMIRRLYALPYEIFEIMDYEARHYCILRLSMAEDIRMIITLNPNTIFVICQKIDRWKEKIIRDIEKGTIDASFDIPSDIRKKAEENLKPDPKRSERLEAILREKGLLLPAHFWPNLRLISCWKAGTMKVYLKELASFFGGVPVRDIGCLSTEAHCSVPVNDDGASGILAIDANFYEFLPRDETKEENAKTLLCDEVKIGGEYYIIVTTAGGLYRYDIDDLVRVTGFFNRTPMIEFLQKGIGIVSLAGEKLCESHVNEAVKRAVEKTGIFVEFFCAVARKNPPRYVFLAEFTSDIPKEDKIKFMRAMEEELYKQNREYRFVRSSQILLPPALKTVKRGSFERYRKAKGAHNGQFKVQELTADENFEKNFEIEEEINL